MYPEEFFFITIWALMAMFMLRYVLVAIVGHERMGIKKKGRRSTASDGHMEALQSQVDTLTERVKVLEKITVEDGNSLAAEIERLREPEQLGYGGADDLTAPQRSRNRV